MNSWCESCARKSQCYTADIRPKCYVAITSNDRTVDRKTEPFDKDINVRSKDEPQTYKPTCNGECRYCQHDLQLRDAGKKWTAMRI